MERTIYNEKTIKIDGNVHKALKAYQVQHEYQSMSEAIEQLIKWWNWWAGNKK